MRGYKCHTLVARWSKLIVLIAQLTSCSFEHGLTNTGTIASDSIKTLTKQKDDKKDQ